MNYTTIQTYSKVSSLHNISKYARDVGVPVRTCQYLEGKPKGRNFCGKEIYYRSYCKEHSDICYKYIVRHTENT